MRSKKWVLFLLPSLLGISIFVLLPFADVVRRSFTTSLMGKWRGLENYKTILANDAFWLAVKNTARFTAVCLPLLLLLALVVAWMLQQLTNIAFLKSCYLFPLALPSGAVVLIWKMVFSQAGFLNLFLTRISGHNVTIDYMGTELSFYILVFSYVWKNLGYTVVLWLAGFYRISADILEAAEVDGAGKWRTFFSIMLPNMKGTVFMITVLSFLNSFKVFREAYLVAGAYPQESMYLLQHLFNNWFFNLDVDKMAAAAVLIALVLLGIILILQKMWDVEE